MFIQFFNLHKTMEEEEKERIALGGSIVPEKIHPGEALEPVSSVHARYPLDAVTSLRSI